MHKRRFLTAAAAGAAGAAMKVAAAPAAPPPRTDPVLLTVSGAIGRGNRGPLDPALDQMMVKHGIRFDRAHAFDAESLRRLPATTIRPTLEYDGRVHELSGPLLTAVLLAAGVTAEPSWTVALRAVDGYQVALSLSDVARYRVIVATRIDGAALPLGGLGPQWAVFDADRVTPFKDKPLKERFGLCPWGLYHIDVRTPPAA